MDRRQLLTGLTALALLPVTARAQTVSRRPAPADRRFISPAIDACIDEMKRVIKDPELAQLFENCFPNTLDTTVTTGTVDGKPDTFVITGDIDAMWLRDSSAQVWPYLPFAAKDNALRTLFQGVIQRQARSILIDPYANAFMRDPEASTNLVWSLHDKTDMRPGVAERKWEIDSLCWPVRLAHGYWQATGDATPFDETWRQAMRLVPVTFRQQQRKDNDGPYHFQRAAENPVDTLPLNGFGAPSKKVGLIHSGFRPSDDSCVLPFLVPSNHFAVTSLRQLAEMAGPLGLGDGFALDCKALADEVTAALMVWGRTHLPTGETVWAYEVDGYGNAIFMDDANTPGLLGLPYLGACGKTDPLYVATRKAVWSAANPYFFSGKAASGIGGPHIGRGMVWPMSLMMYALTATRDDDIRMSLNTLKATHAGTGFMHEAFNTDDPAKYTRPWFAWANTLFGELILDIYRRKPALLA
ncbi:glycoside hydrolase family 125 protein [Asticcacaulis solisilvae]|uniref:glycoside hydrolase family 125 protein n=1 Tax=Asticcacaulis solisilvae TaxID=1217274 RepID=UPI003FD7D2DC